MLPIQVGANAGLRRFINVCGGDSVVSGVHAYGFGASVTAGLVTTLTDARGSSGHGPSLTSGAVGPTYDTTNLTITNSLTSYLQSATNAVYNAGTATALVVCGTQTTTSGGVMATVRDSSSGNSYVQVYNDGGDIGAKGLGSDTPIAGTVAVSATVYRTMIGSVNGTTGINIDVPNQARASTTGTAQSSLSCALSLFGSWQAANPSVSSIRLAGVLNKVPATQLSNWIGQFMTWRYGAVGA